MSAFDALHRPNSPVVPDRRFADELRARLVAELAPPVDLPARSVTGPERTTMSPTDITPDAPPPGGASITAYLAVHDAVRAIDWYVDVFGAREVVRYVGDDGRIGHAELDVGGAVFYLSDEYPEMGVAAPPTIGGSPAAFVLNVPDVDAVYAAAVTAGADGLRPPDDQAYGDRSSSLVDPFGHRWMVQSTIAAPTPAEIDAAMDGFQVQPADDPHTTVPAEIGYIAIAVDDTERAAAFYEALFGWRTEPGHMGPGYAHVATTRLPIGFTPEGNATQPSLYVRVDDVDTAATRAVELGGELVERSDGPSGAIVACTDVQGRRFHMWQPARGY